MASRARDAERATIIANDSHLRLVRFLLRGSTTQTPAID